MLFSRITSFIVLIFYTFTSAFSGVAGTFWYGREKYSVADSSSILLDVALISDTHSDSAYYHDRS